MLSNTRAKLHRRWSGTGCGRRRPPKHALYELRSPKNPLVMCPPLASLPGLREIVPEAGTACFVPCVA
jgi:hypothetical protein